MILRGLELGAMPEHGVHDDGFGLRPERLAAFLHSAADVTCYDPSGEKMDTQCLGSSLLTPRETRGDAPDGSHARNFCAATIGDVILIARP